MGKWGLSDTIANDESFLSFGQLSFGVPDVRGADEQPQVGARPGGGGVSLLLRRTELA